MKRLLLLTVAILFALPSPFAWGQEDNNTLALKQESLSKLQYMLELKVRALKAQHQAYKKEWAKTGKRMHIWTPYVSLWGERPFYEDVSPWSAAGLLYKDAAASYLQGDPNALIVLEQAVRLEQNAAERRRNIRNRTNQ